MKIAIISDLHSNKYAVDRVFNDINKESVDHILVAGDLVGYYYWPSEVVQLCMRDSRVQCIQGNHEANLKQASESSESISRLTKQYGSGYKRCIQSMSSKEMNWLFSLPIELTIEIGGITFYLSHGSLSSTDEYLYPNAPIEKLISNYSNADFTVFGHTHYSFIHTNKNLCLLNPGSVGQPRDHGNLSSYAIVDSTNRTVRFKKVLFETEKIIAAVNEFDPSLPYLKDVLTRGTP